MSESYYEYTHLTYRKRNEDGTVSNFVHTIDDRERAADEIRELALNTDVFALRFIHYGEHLGAESADGLTMYKVGPPVTA